MVPARTLLTLVGKDDDIVTLVGSSQSKASSTQVPVLGDQLAFDTVATGLLEQRILLR